MNNIDVKVFSSSEEVNNIPKYGTENSAGADFYCDYCEYDNRNNGEASYMPNYVLLPGMTVRVHTGIYMAIPEGFYMQLNPRSGLACKYGITLANSPGIIDSDYRGEIVIVLRNEGCQPVTISHGDRIAQGIFIEYSRANFINVESLSKLGDTDRGNGGFGSTGKN